MVQIDRRRFLQLAGGATAATAMAGGFADTIARAATLPSIKVRRDSRPSRTSPSDGFPDVFDTRSSSIDIATAFLPRLM